MLSAQEQVGGAANVRGVRAGAKSRKGLALVFGVHHRVSRILVQNIFRQTDVDRAGAAAGRNSKGAAECFGDQLGALDLETRFGDRFKHAILIERGQNIFALAAQRSIGGECDDRNRRRVRFGHAGREIRRARAAGRFADADAAAHARVTIGHETGGALFADEDVRNLIARLCQCSVE